MASTRRGRFRGVDDPGYGLADRVGLRLVGLEAMSEARILVRLQPRASRDEVLGLSGGGLRARVSAPAVDGRANRALRRLIAREFGVAPSRVTIVRGERSREKLVRIDGLDEAAVREALERHS